MNKSLLFASANIHKLEEISALLPAGYSIQGLKDIGWTEDIPEPFETFHENAAAKTRYLYQATGMLCFAEDSGLEIDALNGRPGVYSARYAGTHGDSQANIVKVLDELQDNTNRTARFISVIAFQTGPDTLHFFSGFVAGDISYRPSGSGGFGYDPIFIPKGFDQPFAVLPPRLKNYISHRARAMHQFLTFLREFKN